ATRLLGAPRVAGEPERDLRSAVGDVYLLAVDEVPIAFLRDPRRDPAQIRSRLGLRQIHRALEIAGDEAGQVALLQLVAAVLLDVEGDACLPADDRHQARGGAGHHPEVRRVDERGQAVAAVLGMHAVADQPAAAQLRVAGPVVRGYDAPAERRA